VQVKHGDRVKVHYTLKDAGGQVIETSREFTPIEFTVGKGNVIPGFEKGIVGMKTNELKTITIPPDEAYGVHDINKVFEFERKNAPNDFDPRIGDTIRMHRPDGKTVPVTVMAVSDKCFTMDANHPLAGKELVFDLELMEIVTAESK